MMNKNVDIRGKLHLNANDAQQLHQSKKMNRGADLFNNKNYDIFVNGYEERDTLDA